MACVDELLATQEARAIVEGRYLDGHRALFPDTTRAWEAQLTATKRPAIVAHGLAEADGCQDIEPADPDAVPSRAAALVADLVEPAKATALEKLGEGKRAFGIAAAPDSSCRTDTDGSREVPDADAARGKPASATAERQRESIRAKIGISAGPVLADYRQTLLPQRDELVRRPTSTMKSRRIAGVIGLTLVMSLAACGTLPEPSWSGGAPTSTPPTATAMAASGSSVPTSSALAAPTPTPIMPSATPVPPAAEEWVDVTIPIYVAFVGQSVAMEATSSETGGPTNLLLASATVDFGDGTAATVRGSCRARIEFSHRYPAAGDYRPRVTAINACDPSIGAHLSGPLQTVHVFPAAPAVSAHWPTCSASGLRLAGFAAGVGLGNVAARITLASIGQRNCVLEGYPRVVLVGHDGRALPTDARAATTGAYLFAAVVPARVALRPGDTASFMLGYTDNPFGADANKPYDVACPAASTVRVTLPDSVGDAVARVDVSACGGLIEVSPIVPGTSGLRP